MNYVISTSFQVQGNDVYFKGVQLPPCPARTKTVSIVNDKIYIGGYEWTGTKWKRTLCALCHMWF